LLQGTVIGATIATLWTFSDLPICREALGTVKHPGISFARVSAEVDSFYSHPAYRHLPVGFAMVYVFRSLRGDSKQTLETFLNAALKTYKK
jgi:hypothetical protein